MGDNESSHANTTIAPQANEEQPRSGSTCDDDLLMHRHRAPQENDHEGPEPQSGSNGGDLLMASQENDHELQSGSNFDDLFDVSDSDQMCDDWLRETSDSSDVIGKYYQL